MYAQDKPNSRKLYWQYTRLLWVWNRWRLSGCEDAINGPRDRAQSMHDRDSDCASYRTWNWVRSCHMGGHIETKSWHIINVPDRTGLVLNGNAVRYRFLLKLCLVNCFMASKMTLIGSTKTLFELSTSLRYLTL